MPNSIEWADVKPGMVVMGSADRSILFGGIGPRHEVSIDIVSKSPDSCSLEEALKIFNHLKPI